MRAIGFLSVAAALVLTGCATADTSGSEPVRATPLTGQERVADANAEALNVWEWGQAARILENAALLIEERGWQQGATGPVRAECITTAIENAFYDGANFTIVDFNYAREALSEVIGVEREPEGLAEVPVAVPYWGELLLAWNDEPNRTEEEVLEALRDAASLATQYQETAVEDDVRLD